jgi:acetylornithine deacetylase
MAIQTLIESGVKLKDDVILALVADEEYASIGTEAVVTEYGADAAIICEPTDLQIVIAHKGFAWIRIDIFGPSGDGEHEAVEYVDLDSVITTTRVLVRTIVDFCNS